MTAKTVFKCLSAGGRSKHNFYLNDSPFWSMPNNGMPGDWKREPKNIVLRPHFAGIHLSEPKDMVLWFSAENYLAEHGSRIATTEDCLVTNAARLQQRIPFSHRHWHKLALGWLDDVKELPDRLAYKWEYGYYARHAHSILTDRFNGTTKGRPTEGEEHVRLSMHRMSADQKRDSGCTTMYTENCLAMHETANAYGAALDYALHGDPRNAWEMAKRVSMHTREARVHEETQTRLSRPRDSEAVDVHGLRRQTAVNQNAPLLKIIQSFGIKC